MDLESSVQYFFEWEAAGVHSGRRIWNMRGETIMSSRSYRQLLGFDSRYSQNSSGPAHDKG